MSKVDEIFKEYELVDIELKKLKDKKEILKTFLTTALSESNSERITFDTDLNTWSVKITERKTKSLDKDALKLELGDKYDLFWFEKKTSFVDVRKKKREDKPAIYEEMKKMMSE